MRFKLVLLSLSFLMVFSSLAPSFTQASAGSSNGNKVMELSEEVIEIADPYIELQNNGYKINDVKSLKEELSQAEFVLVRQKINEQNRTLREFTSSDWDKANIEDKTISFFEEPNNDFSLMSAGRNGIVSYWWGYRVYLNNNLTNTTYQILAGGAGASAIVGAWAPFMTAPTLLIRAVATTFVITLGGSAAMIRDTNNGSGIYLRFTGLEPYIVYTGMFPQ